MVTCAESLKARVAAPQLIAIVQPRLRTACKHVRVHLHIANGLVKYAFSSQGPEKQCSLVPSPAREPADATDSTAPASLESLENAVSASDSLSGSVGASELTSRDHAGSRQQQANEHPETWVTESPGLQVL